ncbi:MAG: hypothetical protein NZ455_11060 [Bacteroidia bacterium]|nr:hypothetical protein [Bacteroidia bacterium]
MREACGGRASARCVALAKHRSKAQPVARRPERSEGTRPKKYHKHASEIKVNIVPTIMMDKVEFYLYHRLPFLQ